MSVQYEVFPLLLSGKDHAESKFCIIFKERIGPGRSMTLAVFRVCQAGNHGAPGLSTACRICDEHTGTKYLGQDFHVTGLGTAGTGTGKFEERTLELAAFYGKHINICLFCRKCLGVTPVLVFRTLRFKWFHRKRFCRTDICTASTAIAVQWRNLHTEFIAVQIFTDGFFRFK